MAMASPCEVLVETEDREIAASLLQRVWDEAERIESKFSRYRQDNIVHRINTSDGRPVEVDAETAQLLDFAQTLYVLSEGLFDITSGILRTVWTFDGGNRIPDQSDINPLLPRIGWERAHWEMPFLSLQPGMQIDLGGIGKEYAVDRAIQIIRAHSDAPCLVNFGGDLAITGVRTNQQPWHVGIESAFMPGTISERGIALKQGALATSGDSRRFVLKNGVRYGHILNPKTGWPVAGAPRSVTVAAATCTEAGMLSTLAMLQGENCEQFLQNENIPFWCIR
ncbi:MAG TPA: FAD:protein FMN transferase [Gammaproteobacteria bacterium]|nr:FAD:protein FMN transferase [Gammaproteobacteria bacterium]